MKLPRQMINGKFLERLSQKDIRFVVTTLTHDGNEADSLLKLLSDDGTRRAVLDSHALFEAVRAAKVTLPLSHELHFYILLRHALKAVGLLPTSVAQFLAEALAAFPPAPRPGVHTSDYEEAIKNAKDYEWFVLAVEIANRALILSSIYGEAIYKSKKNYAVASLNRYENIGRSYYRAAAKNKLAEEFELKEILAVLSEDFIKIRGALEAVRESYLKVTEGRA